MLALCLVAQPCLTLCNPMDYRCSGPSVHGDFPGKNTRVEQDAWLSTKKLQGMSISKKKSESEERKRHKNWTQICHSHQSIQTKNFKRLQYLKYWYSVFLLNLACLGSPHSACTNVSWCTILFCSYPISGVFLAKKGTSSLRDCSCVDMRLGSLNQWIFA